MRSRLASNLSNSCETGSSMPSGQPQEHDDNGKNRAGLGPQEGIRRFCLSATIGLLYSTTCPTLGWRGMSMGSFLRGQGVRLARHRLCATATAKVVARTTSAVTLQASYVVLQVTRMDHHRQASRRRPSNPPPRDRDIGASALHESKKAAVRQCQLKEEIVLCLNPSRLLSKVGRR